MRKIIVYSNYQVHIQQLDSLAQFNATDALTVLSPHVFTLKLSVLVETATTITDLTVESRYEKCNSVVEHQPTVFIALDLLEPPLPPDCFFPC